MGGRMLASAAAPVGRGSFLPLAAVRGLCGCSICGLHLLEPRLGYCWLYGEVVAGLARLTQVSGRHLLGACVGEAGALFVATRLPPPAFVATRKSEVVSETLALRLL